jgi:hypothetical protein
LILRKREMMKRILSLGFVALMLSVMPVVAQQRVVALPIAYGDTVQGIITDAQSSVFYGFEGNAGDVVTITLIADDAEQLDTYLALYVDAGDNTIGELVDLNDDAADITLGRRNSQLVDILLPLAGSYLIEATRYGGEGGYTLTLETADNPASASTEDVIYQWAVSASGSSQYGDANWSFDQATGAPNTDDCADLPTAWAAASSSGEEFLILDYQTPVIPTQINIYQTYNPGAIVAVEVINSVTDESAFLPNSTDPIGNTPCPGVFTVDVTDVTFEVDRVAIYLDQSLTENWNEIDAVELVGFGEAITTEEQGLIFDVPEGWAITERGQGEFFLGSSEELLGRALTVGIPAGLEVGEQVIFIYPYDSTLTELEVILPQVADELGNEDTNYGGINLVVTEDTTFAYVTVEENGQEGFLFVVKVEDEVFIVISVAGDLSSAQRILYQLVGTMRFAGETGTGNSVSHAGITVTVPDNFLTSVLDGEIYIGSDSVTLAYMEQGTFDAIDSGKIGISLVNITANHIPGIGTIITTPADALDAFNGLIGSSADVLAYDDVNGAITFPPEGTAPPNTVVIATEAPNGFILWAIRHSDDDTYLDHELTVIDVILSITFD